MKPSSSNEIRCRIDGLSVRLVYTDAAAQLLDTIAGTVTTTRASNVEPHPTLRGWLADMRPVGGRVLGANGSAPSADVRDCTSLDPFKTRQEALDAERDWLRAHLGV